MLFARKPKNNLAEKLGIKSDMRVLILNAPEQYNKSLGKLPDDVSVSHELMGKFDLIHCFFDLRFELEAEFAHLKQHIRQNGALWISWKKGGAKSGSDLSDSIVREIGLRNGLVDVKVASVDDTWSALKFVYRLKDREQQ